ncbi:hypothetical protein GGD66_002312 [Bradyrhizobium sp. CIR48]|uniref:hypothetical protein n=1 Tax=Bradyrhizobium sp. CIR48 TaxID=2663840 RepID=UPI001605E8A9|nr:hypothetical protein [Bradyrhizobium sp. CIR48]MBB4423768.1 hypothetical protein [Bradyrhizobium sp. CIR48]
MPAIAAAHCLIADMVDPGQIRRHHRDLSNLRERDRGGKCCSCGESVGEFDGQLPISPTDEAAMRAFFLLPSS